LFKRNSQVNPGAVVLADPIGFFKIPGLPTLDHNYSENAETLFLFNGKA
jgi:hypothetical protein